MKYLITVATLFCFTSAFAQSHPLKYTGSIEGGMLNGSYQTTGYLLTTHGVAMKTWKLSMGTGIDFYRIRTVPVFLELRKEIGKGVNRPFLYTAAGGSFVWTTERQESESMGWEMQKSSFQNGFYSRAGAGMIFNAAKHNRLAVSLGWSYKTIGEKFSQTDWIWGIWPQPNEHNIRYRLHRVQFGVHLLF